ncbi:membrane protein (plasmid) [Fulvitalea axinellae]|uniref:Membrane protein n=1 Tax=Fulvitalea axinellae TaxID=1182444 RepID=A0AAU9CMF7_9BACT|nr:membrane protein [Fulvitalea axinellae]
MGTATKQRRPLWSFPWAYREGFVVSFGLLVTGFMLEGISANTSTDFALRWPTNLFVGLGFTAFVALVYFRWRKNPIIKWLSGVPAAITSTALMGILVVILGILPQGVPAEEGGLVARFGLNQMTTSWPFLFAMGFFMLTLGFASLKRIYPVRKNNFGYLLNHLGLWITLLAAMLGSGDLIRLTMDLYEGKPEWRATDIEGNMYEMPLALKLEDFNIEQYRPKVAIVDNKDGKLRPSGAPHMVLIEHEGIEGKLLDNTVKVLKYLPSAKRVGDRYERVNEVGAGPAALVSITGPDGKASEAWISCGSFMMMPEAMTLSDEYSVVMTAPEPKKFSSELKIMTPDGKETEATVEVNSPYAIDGWKLYQLSYNSQMGKWSNLSVVELVRDPWLPVVYFGVFMMIFGSLYILWVGKGIGEKVGNAVKKAVDKPLEKEAA